MEITLLAILGLVFQVIGFVFLCRFGARLSDELAKTSQWLPLGVGAIIIAIGAVTAFVFGQPLPWLIQTAALFCVAFGGGFVARQHNRITGE
jgi:hypothetical protein